MARRERFFGCTLTSGDRQVEERSVRAWDAAEAVESFAALLRDAGFREPGMIEVRDGAGRVVHSASYPRREQQPNETRPATSR